MGRADDRRVVAEMRGDSRLRRALFYAGAWVGIATFLFLVTLRIGGYSLGFWTLSRAQVALAACALVAAPLAWWAARRQRPDYGALDQRDPRALEVSDLPRIGYRDAVRREAEKAAPESDEPGSSIARPGGRRWLGAAVLLAAVAGGTIFGHPVPVAMLAGASVALSCVALLAAYLVQQALERRHRRIPAAELQDVRIRIETGSDAEAEAEAEAEDDVSDARVASERDARRP